MPWVGLQCVIVVFPDHTHLLFYGGFNLKTFLSMRGLGPDVVSVDGPTRLKLYDNSDLVFSCKYC